MANFLFCGFKYRDSKLKHEQLEQSNKATTGKRNKSLNLIVLHLNRHLDPDITIGIPCWFEVEDVIHLTISWPYNEFKYRGSNRNSRNTVRSGSGR